MTGRHPTTRGRECALAWAAVLLLSLAPGCHFLAPAPPATTLPIVRLGGVPRVVTWRSRITDCAWSIAAYVHRIEGEPVVRLEFVGVSEELCSAGHLRVRLDIAGQTPTISELPDLRLNNRSTVEMWVPIPDVGDGRRQATLSMSASTDDEPIEERRVSVQAEQ